MVAAVIPLIGAIISAMPTLYSAFKRGQTFKTGAGTLVDVSKLAKSMLADYLKVSKEISTAELESELLKLDKEHVLALAKLEASFQQKVTTMGFEVDLAEYKLAMERMKILQTDIIHGNWFDRSWRPTLFWGCTLLVLIKGFMGLVGGSLLEYLPGLTPVVEHMVHFSLKDYREIIMIALGVGIASRTVEKLKRPQIGG